MVGLDDDENLPLMTDHDRPPSPEIRSEPRAVSPNDDSSSGPSAQSNSKTTATTTITATTASSSSSSSSEHPDAPLDARPSEGIHVDDSGTSTPRFIQDEQRSWKKLRWIPYPVRRTGKAIACWARGPPTPRRYRITPLFPQVQEWPLHVVDRFFPKRRQRLWLLFVYFSLWLVAFVLVKRDGAVSTQIQGWGNPSDISCGVSYWGADNSCGIDGNDCRPFDESGFAFRCPANCESYHLLNPRAVGDTEVVYRSLVVGGPGDDGVATYRGDSYICAAGIHAGIVSNARGGCGVVRLVGHAEGFPASKQNGISSVGFDSYFPLSYQFEEDINCSASDNRWPLLGLSASMTALLSLFTSSAAVFFFPIFSAIFWTIGMAIDSPHAYNVTELFTIILGKYLPAMFVAFVMFDRMGVKRTLGGLRAQIEKTILWLGPCWVGAMDNYTLSRLIPLQRLNAHDLQQQPGAKAALSIIIIILVVVIVFQVWFFRQEGRLLKYLRLYALFIAAILISLLLPGVSLRIHHYILALLLLPGTSIQTRPSLIFQGLLIGLFINGIARWGFDPVLQTPGALQGDAQLGSELPIIPAPNITLSDSADVWSNITFTWDMPQQPEWDGISVLVNDVERFRAYFADEIDHNEEFVWFRNSTLDLPEYFRFAFMDGSSSGDYTKAGIWTADGEWTEMAAGPSRVKRGAPPDEVLKGR